MKSENKKEGWVSFERCYFKKGWIDRCMTDQANDPNKDRPAGQQFNTIISHLRLNDGKWVNTRKIGGLPKFISMLRFADEYTAEEVWNTFVDGRVYSLTD